MTANAQSFSRMAIGLGCRKEARAEAIAALVRTALKSLDCAPPPPCFLCSVSAKEHQRALSDAAVMLGMPLVFFPLETLRAQSAKTLTHSARVVELFGVPSIAETAALAGAGAMARLIAPRIAADGVACAIAVVEETHAAQEGAEEAKAP